MVQHTSSQVESAISEYTPRATSYESSNAGWHADLADDFISWVKPSPGDKVLDLACGTGLVTFRMSHASGPQGVVIGIDVTPAMLDVARSQLSTHDPQTAPITFLEADITSPTLATLEPVRSILEKSGFDIVSCCSAVILLDDPTSAIAFWKSLLRSGGRLIFDVPTEDRTVQYLATNLLGPRGVLNFSNCNRAGIRGPQSVKLMVEGSGLVVEQVFRTRSWLPERDFGAGDEEMVWKEEVLGKYGRKFMEMGMAEEVRKEWSEVWREEVERSQDGRVRDGHWLYVCVARKRGRD